MNQALFLDRDGIVNRMVLYKNEFDSPRHPKDVRLVDGIGQLIRHARQLGYLILVITNQPGVAKGKLTPLLDQRVRQRIRQLLTLEEADWDEYYVCPHHPDAKSEIYRVICECRKPKPGLIIEAQKRFQLNLNHCLFLGDTATDVETGKAVGVKTLLYLHSENLPEKVEAAYQAPADLRFESLLNFIPVLTKLSQGV